MDPIDKIFTRNHHNVNAIENDKEITRDELKRLIVLQHQKLLVLKKSKSYWNMYKISNEKRKRNKPNLIATNSAVDFRGLPPPPSTVSANCKYPPQNRNVGFNPVVQSNPLYDQHGRMPAVSGPQPIFSEHVPSIKFIQQSTPSISKAHPPVSTIQQSIGVAANTMFNQYYNFIRSDYADTLKQWLSTTPHCEMPPTQLYLTSRIVSAVTSDIVSNYYVNVKFARDFDLPIQKSLLYHSELPICVQCSSDTSSLWYKVGNTNTGGIAHKCHRCVSILNNAKHVPVPITTGDHVPSKTIDGGKGAIESTTKLKKPASEDGNIVGKGQLNKNNNAAGLPPKTSDEAVETISLDNDDDDVIFVSSPNLKEIKAKQSSKPPENQDSCLSITSTITVKNSLCSGVTVPPQKSVVNDAQRLPTYPTKNGASNSNSNSSNPEPLPFVKATPMSSSSFSTVNNLIESSDAMDVIDAKN